MFSLPNCFQNLRAGCANWTLNYCITMTIQWINYLLLSCLLSFLLTLHCLEYKKINKRCSLLIFKRNRVQILTLSVVLTTNLFIKINFTWDYLDLLLLVFAQLLRFVIWSLCLLNFMKSATSLVPNPRIKVIIRFLKIYIYIGVAFYVSYGITLIFIKEFKNKYILNCKSPEFIIQASFATLTLSIFHYYAVQVT